MTSVVRADQIRELRELTCRIENAHRRIGAGRHISTGNAELDGIVSGSGFECGTLVEWLSEREGSGAVALAFCVARRALACGGAFVVIESASEFYPPAAAAMGIPLDRTVLVRPDSPRSALWAYEQSLRFRGVAVTLGRVERLNDRPFRRLQLAAEAGGGLGFLLRPAACRTEPSWAALRLLVAAMPSAELTRRFRVEVLHNRCGPAGRIVDLELDHEANLVSLASELADSAPAHRTAGA